MKSKSSETSFFGNSFKIQKEKGYKNIKALQEGKLEKITLAKLPQEIMQKLGAKTNGLLLSQATLKEHLERHPEINLLDYSLLPFLIRDTNVYKVKESKENHIVYFSKFGSYYKAVFKVTQNKEEVFLVSLSKGNKKI